jgi:spore germination cell wall hydrolase CwlJ-like protein
MRIFTAAVVVAAVFCSCSFLDNIDNKVPEAYVVDLSTVAILDIPREPVVLYRSRPLNITANELTCLKHNIYYEAGAESYHGKIAVAQVTLNRLREGRWGNDICKVVYAPYQFSWTRQKKKAPHGPLWEESKRAAHDAISGIRVEGLTRSLYFHAMWVSKPSWAQRKIESHQIGQHVFYASK